VSKVGGRRRTASFAGLAPSSARSSAAARASSRKEHSRPEVLLRKHLWQRGLRYRLHGRALPGRPDIVFPGPRVVVFCDGDFWHGRELNKRMEKLARGNNAPYWLAKISGNVERDVAQTLALQSLGWVVLRFWETDILSDPNIVAEAVAHALVSAQHI
jgi:DNA mismatch endonuclease, patch repair protein